LLSNQRTLDLALAHSPFMRTILIRLGLAIVTASPLVALVGLNCRSIDVGPGNQPLSEFSANISAGDLLDPRSSPDRLARYLDELTALGYKKQVRIILPPDWGPGIYEHWFPVLRARGFKVLAILGQERRDSAADVPAAIAWIERIVPLVRADLMGIQIVNEPAHWFTPEEYVVYHRRIAALLRALAPEVPIVAGDFGVPAKGANTVEHWKAFLAAGTLDYDVLSLHVTGSRQVGELKDFVRRVRDIADGRRTWITEGDWGQLGALREAGLTVQECFIYSWNDDQVTALIRRPGGKFP
jgi:hypothetical protein